MQFRLTAYDPPFLVLPSLLHLLLLLMLMPLLLVLVLLLFPWLIKKTDRNSMLSVIYLRFVCVSIAFLLFSLCCPCRVCLGLYYLLHLSCCFVCFYTFLLTRILFGLPFLRETYAAGPAGLEDSPLRQQLEKPKGVYNTS